MAVVFKIHTHQLKLAAIFSSPVLDQFSQTSTPDRKNRKAGKPLPCSSYLYKGFRSSIDGHTFKLRRHDLLEKVLDHSFQIILRALFIFRARSAFFQLPVSAGPNASDLQARFLPSSRTRGKNHEPIDLLQGSV